MCSSGRCKARRAGTPAVRVGSTIAVLAVTLLVAGCGAAAPPRPDVALLPSARASSHVWRWTGQCPVAPTANQGCGTAGPILGFAQLNGDAWNLGGPASAGSLDMSAGSGGAVTIEGRFAHAAPCTESACLAPSAFTWVRGYPSVLYGINQCYADSSPAALATAAIPDAPGLDPAPSDRRDRLFRPDVRRSPTTSRTTCGCTRRGPRGRADPRARSRSWYGPTTTPERSCRPACRSGRPVFPTPSAGSRARARRRGPSTPATSTAVDAPRRGAAPSGSCRARPTSSATVE